LLFTFVDVVVVGVLDILVGVVGLISGGGVFLIAQGITKLSPIFIVLFQAKRFCSFIFDSSISYFLAIEEIVSHETTL